MLIETMSEDAARQMAGAEDESMYFNPYSHGLFFCA